MDVNLSSFSKLMGLLKSSWKVIGSVVSTIAKGISETGPVGKKASVSDIDSVIEAFEAYKEEVRKRSFYIEGAVYEEVSCYMEELRNFLDGRAALFGKYGISRRRAMRQIQKLLTGTKGFIDREVSKGMSLNNHELRMIIGMIPRDRKEGCMERFASKVYRDSLDAYCRHIRGILSEIFEEIEDDVVCVAEAEEERTCRSRILLENINEDNYEGQLEGTIAKAGFVICSCGILEKILEEQGNGTF